jgi:hypothetical protein
MGFDKTYQIEEQRFYVCTIYTTFYISKGKSVQLQAWTGPEGSRRLRLPDFKTTGT